MYKPFVDHLQQELFRKFDLQTRTIPKGLAYKVSDRGKSPSTIESWAYQCPKIRKIRYTHMVAGETLEGKYSTASCIQVMNVKSHF